MDDFSVLELLDGSVRWDGSGDPRLGRGWSDDRNDAIIAKDSRNSPCYSN